MSAPRRILLLSRAKELAPALRRLAEERALLFVRAGDAPSAYKKLQQDPPEGVLFDLDALGDQAEAFLKRVRGLCPGLPALGFGRMAMGRPAAQVLGVPVVSKPLRWDTLNHAFGATGLGSQERVDVLSTEHNTTTRPQAAGLLLDTSQEELRTRVSQLTTLYQLAHAISESRNWSEALDYFLTTLCEYSSARGASILLYSREGKQLTPRTVLGMPDHDVERCVRLLLETYPVGKPFSQIHALDCYETEPTLRCTSHAGTWSHTVLPLLYRRTPLGFLVLDKTYTGGGEFTGELFFLQTVQTILREEVANAVHLSKLVDLKNFNETVLENIESGVLTANEHGEVHFLNRMARQILGQVAGREIELPLRFDTLFRSPAGSSGEEPVFQRILSTQANTSFIGELARLDGDQVPVRLRTSQSRNPSDSELLVVVAFEDLTEQRLLEEQARRSDRLRSLGELSAAIAHEVRNPLQGISLTLSNLQEHLTEGAEPYVQVMFSEMERLNGIVGNILSFARPAPPQARSTSLAALCERALDLAAEHAATRQVRFEFDRGQEDGLCEMDEGQILQVVLNVVLNAIDASPVGGVVRLGLQDAPKRLLPGLVDTESGPFLRLEVQDQGLGIRAQDRDKLFDPFFTTKNEGTGLGLSVSSKIVEEHNGCIHVENQPGSGTRFVIELPRHFNKRETSFDLQPSREGA